MLEAINYNAAISRDFFQSFKEKSFINVIQEAADLLNLHIFSIKDLINIIVLLPKTIGFCCYENVGNKEVISFFYVWQQKVLGKLDCFNSKELIKSLWTFMRLNIKPNEEFIVKWKEVIFLRLSELDNHKLISCVHIAVWLGFQYDDKFVVSLYKNALKKLEHFTNQGLIIAIEVLYKVKYSI